MCYCVGKYDILSSLDSQLSYAYFGISWLPEKICRAVTGPCGIYFPCPSGNFLDFSSVAVLPIFAASSSCPLLT
jgi:hypothetical protein